MQVGGRAFVIAFRADERQFAFQVFAVQTEVAEKVAAALGGDLTMGEINAPSACARTT